MTDLQPFTGITRFPAMHCVTGSMLRIYRWQGIAISEPMLFGLGAGLGFVYWHQSGDTPFIGGRANVGRKGELGLELTAGQRTGVVIQRHQTSSPARAGKALLQMLEDEIPVMLYVDMAYLPYLGLPPDYHFGAHMITIIGYDAHSQRVLVADREQDFYPLAMQDLEQARASKHKPFPPKQAWFSYDFAAMRPPRKEDIRAAIGDVCCTMLDAPIANLGVRGIARAAQRIRRWTKDLRADQLRSTCFNTFIFIDARGGTGGGIFRRMYSAFLNEAAPLCDQAVWQRQADRLDDVANLWDAAASQFRCASAGDSVDENLAQAADRLEELAAREQEIWKELRLTL